MATFIILLVEVFKVLQRPLYNTIWVTVMEMLAFGGSKKKAIT